MSYHVDERFSAMKWNWTLVLRIIFVMTAAALVVNALAIRRDYQDGWVLEGLVIPFALFMAAFAVTFVYEKKLYILAVLAVACRVVLIALPALKYVWFQGNYIDQAVQYYLANHVVSTGHLPASD